MATPENCSHFNFSGELPRIDEGVFEGPHGVRGHLTEPELLELGSRQGPLLRAALTEVEQASSEGLDSNGLAIRIVNLTLKSLSQQYGRFEDSKELIDMMGADVLNWNEISTPTILGASLPIELDPPAAA